MKRADETSEIATLRPLTPSDAPRIAEICSVWDVARMTRSVPWPYTRADAEAFIEGLSDSEGAVWGVVDARSGGLIGTAGLIRSNGVDEIGYMIARDAQGRGAATAAGADLLARTFGVDGPPELWATVFQDNPASARVLRKLGFRYERDDVGRSRARTAGGAPGPHPLWVYRLARSWWEQGDEVPG